VYCARPGPLEDDWGIYVSDPEGSNRVQLTATAAWGAGDYDPAWSQLVEKGTPVSPVSWGQVKSKSR